MKMKSLLLVVCMLARVAFGGETIVSFAKESLGLDLAAIPFGNAARTNAGYGTAELPLSGLGLPNGTGLSWMTNSVSEKYNHDFPNRFLKYGFHDGRLAAVRISISAFGGPGFNGGTGRWELVEQRRKVLLQIQAELIKARKAEKADPFADARFDIQYGAMCSPSPESLFLMEIQITPVEKASWGTGIIPGENKKAP